MENKQERLCSFFISKWHMITILLPFLNKEIENENEIIIITKEKFFENIKKLKEKVKIYNIEKILEYEEKEFNKTNIKEIIDKVKIGNENKTLNIIITGTIEYVESVNNEIKEIINQLENKYKKIKIVDCYNLNNYTGGLLEILEKHEKQLNTKGETKIEDIYDIYEKKKIIVVNGNS